MKKKYVQALLFIVVSASIGFMIGTTTAMVKNNSQSKRSVSVSSKVNGNNKDNKINEDSKQENQKENDSEAIVVGKASNLQATETTSTTTKLTWTPPENTNGLQSYNIYKGEEVIAQVPGENTSYLVEGLSVNSIYAFKVTCNYSNGAESKPGAVNVRTKK